MQDWDEEIEELNVEDKGLSHCYFTEGSTHVM